MPRIKISLEPFKDQIISWYLTENHTRPEIIRRLHGLGIEGLSETTLKRRLHRWGAVVQKKVEDTFELREAIKRIFHNLRSNDDETLQMLCADGFTVTQTALKRIRREMGLYKKIPAERVEEVEEAMLEFLNQEYAAGRAKDLGRKHLYTYTRIHMNLIGR